MEPAQVVNPASLAEKEKYFRFEKISEILTYIAIFSGLIITFFSPNLPADPKAIYLLLASIFAISFCWFRLIPKKFSGLYKTLIYYFWTIILVVVGIHFASGIDSFGIFYLYFLVLSAAAVLPWKYFLSVVVLAVSSILIQGLSPSGLELNQSISITLLHTWALLLVAFFAKNIFDEKKELQAREISDNLKIATQIDLVKNEFVFIISNKLRQPIVTLQNSLEEAFKTKTADWGSDLVDLLTKTRENSHRLARLVSDLSDLSRIENQKLSLDLQPVNLNEIIGSTMSDFSMVATEKKVGLHFEPNPEALVVKADSSRLHEILANLVDNAIKYSPTGTSVTVSYTKEAPAFAKITVADQGYGIPEDAKLHLFEKFYRVNRSSTEPKGTGLGLFVTKELIERQNGKIGFTSEVGKGTQFYFTLPLVLKDEK